MKNKTWKFVTFDGEVLRPEFYGERGDGRWIGAENVREAANKIKARLEKEQEYKAVRNDEIKRGEGGYQRSKAILKSIGNDFNVEWPEQPTNKLFFSKPFESPEAAMLKFRGMEPKLNRAYNTIAYHDHARYGRYLTVSIWRGPSGWWVYETEEQWNERMERETVRLHNAGVK